MCMHIVWQKLVRPKPDRQDRLHGKYYIGSGRAGGGGGMKEGVVL